MHLRKLQHLHWWSLHSLLFPCCSVLRSSFGLISSIRPRHLKIMNYDHLIIRNYDHLIIRTDPFLEGQSTLKINHYFSHLLRYHHASWTPNSRTTCRTGQSYMNWWMSSIALTKQMFSIQIVLTIYSYAA